MGFNILFSDSPFFGGGLSFQVYRKGKNWSYTPLWHKRLVPLFRAFFLLSLPLETYMSHRDWINSVSILGGIGTVAWLIARFIYLRRLKEWTPKSSIIYNTFYVANLICFGLLMNSFFCLAILIHASTLFLWVRIHTTGTKSLFA